MWSCKRAGLRNENKIGMGTIAYSLFIPSHHILAMLAGGRRVSKPSGGTDKGSEDGISQPPTCHVI